MYEYKGKIKKEFIDKALNCLSRYKSDKEDLKKRVIYNTKWYKANYSRIVDKDNQTKPASSYIFSAIENKYADAVDNYPAPNITEREPSDEEAAQLLTKILPTEFDIAGFKRVYKDNARRKLRHGTSIFGIFYNAEKNGLEITAVDILNIYCDMHIKNVQDSQFLFITSCIDNEILKEDYPKCAEFFDGDAAIESYSGSYTLEGRTEITDCYYKKPDGTLHMMKLVGDVVIEATEDIKGYETGLYAHGQYPVVFDVMYPEDDCPFGFGVIDVVQNIQEYIDRLDGAIIKNALLQSQSRYIVKENSGIKISELLDITKDVITATGDISDNAVRALTYEPISEYTLTHRDTKISELKEIIGNRDFQQGGTSGGVTAASAITVLQSAGEKLSRAMCDDSYDSYKQVVIQAIELIREFYDEEKVYRIVNENGTKEYKNFSNKQLLRYEGGFDALGLPIDDEYKRVEFDIEIIPQRENPFSKESNNQTMMTLWNSGVLIADNVKSGASSIILQAMNFDGKEKILSLIEGYKEQLIAAEQQQTAWNAVPKNSQTGTNQILDENMKGAGALEASSDNELAAVDTRTGEILTDSLTADEDEVVPIDLKQLQGGDSE